MKLLCFIIFILLSFTNFSIADEINLAKKFEGKSWSLIPKISKHLFNKKEIPINYFSFGKSKYSQYEVLSKDYTDKQYPIYGTKMRYRMYDPYVKYEEDELFYDYSAWFSYVVSHRLKHYYNYKKRYDKLPNKIKERILNGEFDNFLKRGKGRPREIKFWLEDYYISQVKLNSDQKNKWNRIKSDFISDMRPILDNDIMNSMNSIESALLGHIIYDKKSLLKDISNLFYGDYFKSDYKRQLMRFKLANSLLSILNKDQKDIIDKIRKSSILTHMNSYLVLYMKSCKVDKQIIQEVRAKMMKSK